MNVQDAEWLATYADKEDADAFARLVDRHAGWLVAAARRRLRDEQLAEDATQVVFMLLAEKAGDVACSDRASVAAWLFHSMHFTCCGIRRKRERQARHEAAVCVLPWDEPPPADPGAIAFLEGVIDGLPPRDREAIVRRYYQREKFTDIGVSLGISAESARKRVTRVLAQCCEVMTRSGVEATPESLLGKPSRVDQAASERRQVEDITQRTMTKVRQMESMRFMVMTAEFYVGSVEDNLDYFQKLGFRRHFVETPDADGSAVRASLRGGHTRIWLRRATPDHPPAPGVIVYL